MLDLGPILPLFSVKPMLFATSQISRGNSILFFLQKKLCRYNFHEEKGSIFFTFSTVLKISHCLLNRRALRVAKAVIKENKYGRDKKDNVVYLTDDGKVQEVSNIDVQ